jgi:hypothetical protein
MDSDDSTLQTPRLVLIPLTLDQLRTSLKSIPDLAKKLGVLLVSSLVEGNAGRAVGMKIEKMEKLPLGDHPWQTYWLIVLRAENTGVGLVGFKGKPGINGLVEIGYGIDPVYQGRGYMTEAVCALVDWAFSHPDCKAVTACGVRKDNFASQKVLARNRFMETGEDESGINFIRHKKG